MNKNKKWFLLAVLAMVLGAPNATFMRIAVLEIDPFLVNVLRSGIVAILCVPAIWKARNAFT
ncbi:hypothetical protein KBC77_00150 [Candidatus Saccharibacteria bacterium]|nr:hypothetical protein [Candidatus Saccharibacteria bacterium]